MKSLRILAGTAALALVASALAPVPNAAALERQPLTCNQQLVNCIEQAAVTFDCCTYGADRTTSGVFSDYCAGGSLGYGAPALGVPAASSSSSVPVCLLTFIGTRDACDSAYLLCQLIHPAAPEPKRK